MFDGIFGFVFGILFTTFLLYFLAIAVEETGRNACMGATGVSDCVKEWRPVK